MTYSFASIDPSQCSAAAHPQKHDSTTAFSIQDTTEETKNTVTVSEIATRHLRRLKNSASDYLGKQVSAAVITVPTDFTDAQKAALTEAAKNAGIDVLQYISEPIAALMANDRKNVEKPVDKTVVVADLGGTRSDVAVVSIKGGMYSILATAHDYNLGGNKLDDILMEHFAKEFMKKNKTDPRANERSLAKLRLESEAVKKALSLGNSAGFNCESLADGIDFSSTINRSRYELQAGKVFSSFIRFIESAVEKANLDLLDIDEILLSGGTAHTPRIASNLQSHFPETTTIIAPSTASNTVNPSELTVRGAALQAGLIEGFSHEDVEQSTHPALTVTPHLKEAIGFVVGSENFKPVIPAETPLPVRRTLQFTNSGDSQGVLIRFCEGTREIKVTKPEPKSKSNKPAAANGDDADDEDFDDDDEEEEEDVREKVFKVGTILGELALKDAKKGSKIQVQIQISADLELQVSAMEVGAGKPGVKGVVPGSAQTNGTH